MTKLEEVARALWVDRHPEVAPWPSEVDHMNYLRHARAAIEALREPSEIQAMIARQYFGLNPFEKNGPPMDQTWLMAYRAMFDAILSEGE